MMQSINWVDKAADFAWAIALAVALGVGGAFRRLWQHESRLTALDNHHLERTKQLSEIERKIDSNQHLLLGSMDKLRDDFRADIRMMMSKLIDKVPRGE